jgi:hypothetical protein
MRLIMVLLPFQWVTTTFVLLGCWPVGDWQTTCGGAALECGGFDTALIGGRL